MLGREKFMGVDIRVRVKGGGHVSQTYGEFIVVIVRCLDYELD